MFPAIRCIVANRSRRSATFAILLTACSSGATAVVTPPPPPTTTSSTPASLTIVSGDGQSAAPGAALRVHLSVLGRAARGAAIAGVVVAFTVDSGGGSLAAASATTGANGVAIAGTWTLGAASGTNVVSARVTTLAPVKFHAQAFGVTARTVFSAAPVSTGGGTLTYSKPGDPLNGLTVTVPAGSYPTATQWTITADSSVAVKLPAGFSQVGPALVISNAQGYADSVLTLTVPMPVAANIAVAPFYFDPATGTLEGIPLVARTATSATLAARHFSGDLMAIPGSGVRSSVRASLRLGFGDVNIVWVQVPDAQLVGTWTSGFQVGVDNWEFINYGDYIAPGGDCEGMSITEMYYYYFVRLGSGPPLYHQFDVSLSNPYDNVQGIRFAGSVQGDFSAKWRSGVIQENQLDAAGAANGVSTVTLTSTWILLTLQLTHQPVLMALFGPAGAHAVVAYAATSTGTETDVSFADPNYPSTPRTMTFVGGQLTPVTLATTANAPTDLFTTAYALGVSAEIPITSIASRWSDFLNKTSGSDRYPSQYTLEAFDSVNQVWNSLTDTVRTTINAVKVRVQCPSCPQPLAGAPAGLQYMAVYDASGTILASPNVWLQPGSVFTLTNLALGKLGYVAVASAASPYSSPPGGIGFLDSHNFAVIYGQLSIVSDGLRGRPSTAYTFATASGGLATSTSTFIWDFGDGTPAQLVVGDSTVPHTFAAIGTYQTSVELLDGTGKLVGRDSAMATITHVAWQISTASVTSVLPTGGIGSDPIDTVTQQTVNASLSGLPGDLIFRVDSAACSGIVLELGGGPDSGLVASTHKAVFASSCGGYFGTFSMGTLGSGPVYGYVLHVVPTGALLSESNGLFDAVMTGATLSGTVTWTVPYTGGNGVYTIQFSAVQVEPPP
jgi:hypothetical protein